MKILYVTTISNTINAFLVPHIQMLVEEGHQVDVACKKEKEVDARVYKCGGNVFDIPFSRSPINRDNIRAYKALKKILVEGKYDIVHTHTPIASAIARLVCKELPGIKVIYTAHGFHFYSGAPLINWLIYFPIEMYLSKYTDVLITINREDYNRAKSLFKAKSTEYILGVGLDIEKFQNVSIDRAKKRNEIGVPEDAFVLLSVGELNKNKNHEAVITALGELKNEQIHYVICGEGILRNELKNLCLKRGLSEKVHLLGYREDAFEFYKAADVFVFPSYREGLPVSLMEAMASGLPVICSNVRGNKDLITNQSGGFLINNMDINELIEQINWSFANKEVLCRFGEYNRNRIIKYSLAMIFRGLKDIYHKEME